MVSLVAVEQRAGTYRKKLKIEQRRRGLRGVADGAHEQIAVRAAHAWLDVPALVLV